jgi:DNA replication initiation complex subunit (GINS family)
MIVISQNNSKIFEVDKELFEDVKVFLKNLTKKKKKSFQYIDDIGDTIVVIDGKEYVVPTKEDIKAIQEAKDDEFVSEEEAKKILDL